MTEFKREDDRYVVLKRSDLEKIPSKRAVRFFYEELALISARSCRIPQRKFLVIESDWPEFEPAYKMIEARVTGQPTEVEQLRSLSVSSIMLDVVPGEDGMGEEVYAKSVAEVELVLTALYDKVDLLEEKLAKALEQVELERSLAETMRVQKEDFMRLSDERAQKAKQLKSLLKVVSSHHRHPDFAWPDDLYRDVQRELKKYD